MNLRIKWAAVKVLKHSLGLKKILGLLPQMGDMQKCGEPWIGLPPPQDQKDRDSRALIGDAIIMFKILQKSLSLAEALAITKELILQASIAQLRSIIPKISREKLLALPPAAREPFLKQIIGQFPNAEWEISEIGDDHFSYRINRCRLVELAKAAGVPELADAFCPGDKAYFDNFQPEVDFIRPGTIGGGSPCCDFIFKFKNK